MCVSLLVSKFVPRVAKLLLGKGQHTVSMCCARFGGKFYCQILAVGQMAGKMIYSKGGPTKRQYCCGMLPCQQIII